MKLSRLFLALLAGSIAPAAVAAVSAEDLPSGTIWYMHADLQQMRSTDSGSPIYNWFDNEVVVEINDEFGVSLDDEIDSITAFSDTGTGTVIVPTHDYLKGTRLVSISERKPFSGLIPMIAAFKTQFVEPVEDNQVADEVHSQLTFKLLARLIRFQVEH